MTNDTINLREPPEMALSGENDPNIKQADNTETDE